MRISQLNHVALHVEDVDRSCQFYGEVLKLERIDRPGFSFPGAWFRIGADQELHLIGGRDQPVMSNNRGNHFALMVDDMDAWEDHLGNQGAEYRPRHRRPDGAFQVFVVDPDGHFVELCTVPPA
ncbi:MAG: VOC family protein [Pirellulales bacterium]